MRNFESKVVVVTGAGSGIGEALALGFAKRKAHLAINDIDAERLKNTAKNAESQGVRVFHRVVDMSSKEQVYEFRDQVVQAFGQVDVVVNNAGVALQEISLADIHYDDFDAVMNVNFWGMVYGTKAFLPDLTVGHEAAVANVSSIFGVAGIPKMGAYCTSKFAIRGFTETLRAELYTDAPNVTVHSVHPGGVATNIARNARSVRAAEGQERAEMDEDELGKHLTMDPKVAAENIIWSISRKEERILIGRDAKSLDLVVRVFPNWYSRMVQYFIEKFLEKK